jgi:2-desacetyl-2-hydroxyethyl bacteriochlorophyllide A dehydrogenase
MQAQAAVATQPWRVEFLPVQAPDPTPDDVVIRVQHSWISNGTESSFVRGERIAGDTPRSATDPMPFPHVPGYQKVGIVEWVGANVSGLNPGERVFATVSRVSDMFYDYAGHISPAVTHHSQIWKLPPDLDPVSASGLVLTQVGYNVGMGPALQPGDPAIVLGDGMVGQWSAQTLQHRGARVLLAGKHDERLTLFDAGPDDLRVNITQTDLIEAARVWAPDGVQALADTVGTIPTVESLYPVMRRFSHITSAGFYGHQGLIDIQKMRNREMVLHTPAGWSKARLDATLDLLARGALKTSHLITHHFPAAQAGAAFDLILSRREPVLGVILDWE